MRALISIDGAGKKRIILVGVICAFLVPITIIALALQNPPWARSKPAKRVQAAISSIIFSNVDVVTIPLGQKLNTVFKIPHPKMLALESGKMHVVAAPDIVDDSYSEPSDSMDTFVIATIAPEDLANKDIYEQRETIEAVDNLAVAGKIDAIVETTASDNARLYLFAPGETLRLKDAAVVRCVIFDGGHHIGALALNPDVLLIPAASHKGRLYASHWFTRDSISLKKLSETIHNEELDCVIARFPRFGLPVKNTSGMALLAAQAIKTASQEGLRQNIAPRYEHPQEQVQVIGSRIPGEKALFMSLRISPATTKADILKRMSTELNAQAHSGKNVERAYIGITYGYSRFPYRSKKHEFDNLELENYLNEHLRCEVNVMSEPLSAWDIYLERLRLY